MGLIPRDYYIQTWELRHLVFTHILLKPLCGFELTWTWILGEFTTWSLLKELGDLGFPTKGLMRERPQNQLRCWYFLVSVLTNRRAKDHQSHAPSCSTGIVDKCLLICSKSPIKNQWFWRGPATVLSTPQDWILSAKTISATMDS